MATPSLTSFIVYQGTVTLSTGTPIASGINGTGVIVIGRPYPVDFTAIADATNPFTTQTLTFTAHVPYEAGVNSFPKADVTFYVPPTPFSTQLNYTKAVFPGVVLAASGFTTGPITPLASISAVPSSTTTVADGTRNMSGNTTVLETASASTSVPQTSSTDASIRNNQRSYSAGTLAGAVVGCIIGGILLAGLVVFLCFRRKRSSKKPTLSEPEKQVRLLEGHGEAVYVAGNEAWAKSIPQAEADSTIRAMTSRTLDQIAMHVENFYTAKNNVVLSTEHQFELENIDSSHLPVPTSTLLQQSRRPEQILKHCIASYIISMITFDNNNASGSFLPKAFRKQWQPTAQNVTETQMQAYSRWRVLTAYLRQSDDEDQTYISERNAMIDTAARNVCKAFAPWAKSEEDIRFQNMVGIMKRASELGMQLFSQPARFDWQWQPTTVAGPLATPIAGGQVVILPGLYKMTDQEVRPLTTPLHLVEPVVVALEQL